MNFKELLLYGIASLIIYLFVFAAIYILVDILRCNASISFFIVYLFAYPLAYSIQLVIFKKKRNFKNTFRFILHLMIFFALSNILFNFFYYFNSQHFKSTFLTILFVFPLRYFSSKYFVFIRYF